ncbi:hypothetical protein CCP3SC1_350004 [Gammaproteobacteria bacterium]
MGNDKSWTESENSGPESYRYDKIEKEGGGKKFVMGMLLKFWATFRK